MRDFSNQNLRGRDFRGQDLRGANFSGADIRRARFVDAQLQGADFTGAIAGLQKRWAIGQAILAFVISTTLNLVSVVYDAATMSYYFEESIVKQISIIPGIILVLLVLGLFALLIKEGFTVKALSIIVLVLAGAGVVVGAGAKRPKTTPSKKPSKPQ